MNVGMVPYTIGSRSAGLLACVCCAVFLMGSPLSAAAQVQHAPLMQPCDTLDINYDVDEPPVIDVVDFLPSVIRDQILLKRYIRDPRFTVIRQLCSDTTAVDAIFLRAMAIADGRTGYALLISLIASMDHFRLGLRIPLLGVLWLPLTTETDSTFRVRHHNLPKRVLPDSIGRTESDKDKLQHFFGSAFIAYSTNSRKATEFMGNAI